MYAYNPGETKLGKARWFTWRCVVWGSIILIFLFIGVPGAIALFTDEATEGSQLDGWTDWGHNVIAFIFDY